MKDFSLDGDARHVRARERSRSASRTTDRACTSCRSSARTTRPDALPVENGLIPEDQVDLVDEVDDIPPGTDASLDVNLDAGSYVLVCNLPAHYEPGMYAAFTVA